MDIAKLVAKLELQSSQFQSELEKTNRKLLGFQQQSSKSLNFIEKQARAFGKSLAGIFSGLAAGALLGTLTSGIKKAIQLGDEIGKAAVKAGIGAQAFSELAFAARMADVDMSALSNSIRFMQVAISKASTGGKEQLLTLRALGIELADIRGLKADEQFELLAGAIASLKDPADKARAATELFGRSGAELLPLFEQGAEGIRKAREEAKKFGASFSDDVIATLQKGDEAIKKLSVRWDSFWATAAVAALQVAEALDLINKDKIGELRDELARVNEEIKRIPVSAELGGTPLDPVKWDELTKKAQGLERQIASLNDTYTRGGGSRRGRGDTSAPGFERAAAGPSVIPDAFTREMRESIRAAERWREIVDDADTSTRKWLEDTADLTSVLQDVPEPILELSESLIQADELQKEFTRSMFQNFSDLFMAAGDGARSFGDALLDTFKRILADRATLELFKMLGGLGSSLTGSSGGKGFSGWFGAALTSLFGGYKAEGGPLQQGKWYIAGEHGPEPVWGGGAGAFAMGYGGGVTVQMHNDFRGSTPDAVKLFIAEQPRIIRQAAELAEANLRDKKRRRQF